VTAQSTSTDQKTDSILTATTGLPKRQPFKILYQLSAMVTCLIIDIEILM